MADILIKKRPQVNWSEMGQYAAQPFAAQQNTMYSVLMPLLLKAQLERQGKKQEFQDFLDMASKTGNGPLGNYKLTHTPSGITYEQKSPKEKLEDEIAGKRMGTMQSNQVPQVVDNIVPQANGQVPQVISDIMGNLPSQRITNPDFAISGDPTIENPLFKPALERQTKLQETIGKEEAGANNAIALLDSLEKDWLNTNPTKVTNEGKFSPLGLMKGTLQPAYGVEQRIGSEFQITRNQRADRKYVRRVNSLQSRLAKGVIGQDVGNLSYYEQQAAKGGIAGLSDTYEVGRDMFQSAKQMVKDMKQARIEGYKSLDEKLRAEGRTLTSDMASEYLRKAGGDKEKARQMAIRDRWVF